MQLPEILQIGNPKLRDIAEPITKNEFSSESLQKLADTLFTIITIKGGAGIAATQIGINKRVIAFGLEKHPLYQLQQPIAKTILVNPSIEPLSEDQHEDYEGCMSTGDIRGKVPRYTHIKYSGFDLNGNPIERKAKDFHARLVQHEVDHLDGIIFLDRVKDTTSIGFRGELIEAGILQLNPDE